LPQETPRIAIEQIDGIRAHVCAFTFQSGNHARDSPIDQFVIGVKPDAERRVGHLKSGLPGETESPVLLGPHHRQSLTGDALGSLHGVVVGEVVNQDNGAFRSDSGSNRALDCTGGIPGGNQNGC
jgi:hypothetical protein